VCYEALVKLASLARPLALAALVAAAGCSGNVVQQGPSDTLRAYAQALEQGRVDDAYRLLSDEAKRSMSLEAFRRAVKENPQDAVEIAQALARPSSDPVITATITVPNGEELLLLYEGGKWRIDAAAVDLYGQSTPRQALLGFLRAFERKRYDVILRYVPDAEREGIAAMGEEAPPPAAEKPAPGAQKPPGSIPLTQDKLRSAWEGPEKEHMNRIVQAVRTALPNAQIEETGDSAAMAYGAGGTVAFVREHGVWKIKNF
jgi:hypothetical protein